MKFFINRIFRVMKMDASLFDELAEQPDLISQSVLVVILYALASGIGAMGKLGIPGIAVGSIGSLINWVIWVYIIYSAARIWGSTRKAISPGEFMRAVGFASAPGMIRVLGIISSLRVLSDITAIIWMTVGMASAVKKIFGYSSYWKSFGLCCAGWFMMMFAAYILTFAFRSAGF